ncbi:MAG: aspartate kinase [Crenarchaeota archaeon]|nr:aspartate kinase [Thermoproteota archaeon]
MSAAKGVTNQIIRALDGSREAANEVVERYISIAEDIGGKALAEKIGKLLQPLHRIQKRITSPSLRAELLSLGELASRKILSYQIENVGVKTVQIPAHQIISTQGHPLNASIDYARTLHNLKKKLGVLDKDVRAIIVEGFVGKGDYGRVVLGRGGSDYTATALASLGSARLVHLITDVDGIYTADPKIIENAKRVEVMGYREAEVAAQYGVKNLHPKTFEPLIKIKPVEVRIGTWSKWTTIVTKPEVHPPKIKLVASKRHMNKSRVSLIGSELESPGLISLALELVKSNGIEFNEMTLSPVNYSIVFTVEQHVEALLLSTLHNLVGVY